MSDDEDIIPPTPSPSPPRRKSGKISAFFASRKKSSIAAKENKFVHDPIVDEPQKSSGKVMGKGTPLSLKVKTKERSKEIESSAIKRISSEDDFISTPPRQIKGKELGKNTPTSKLQSLKLSEIAPSIVRTLSEEDFQLETTPSKPETPKQAKKAKGTPRSTKKAKPNAPSAPVSHMPFVNEAFFGYNGNVFNDDKCAKMSPAKKKKSDVLDDDDEYFDPENSDKADHEKFVRLKSGQMGRILYKETSSVHVQHFVSATYLTLLPKELFETEDCSSVNFNDIIEESQVVHFSTDMAFKNSRIKPPKKVYFYRYRKTSGQNLRLEHARKVGNVVDGEECSLCTMKRDMKTKAIIKDATEAKDKPRTYEKFRQNGQSFKIGDAILYIDNKDDRPLFKIGIIKNIRDNILNLIVTVNALIRPEEIGDLRPEDVMKFDNNYVYWSSKTRNIQDVSRIISKCVVVSKKTLQVPIEVWSEEGENRFYFDKAFVNGQEEELPPEAVDFQTPDYGAFPKVEKPYKCLDLFAGCGGLSHGLLDAGVVIAKWAIERDPDAAQSYEKNNPLAKVFSQDCNEILGTLIEAKDGVEKFPKRGEVDIICGGPPCQGYSFMNTNKESEKSKEKNSLVASFYSFCEFYRPKIIIMENVQNIDQKEGVLKAIVHFLTLMNYQFTMDVLQAGYYGLPQSRNRFFLIASAPGTPLPHFPERTHAFKLHAKGQKPLHFNLNGEKFSSECRFMTSQVKGAPYRPITVQEAIDDLPEYADEVVMRYPQEPGSHYQRLMRKNATELRNHQSIKLGERDAKRVQRVKTRGDYKCIVNADTFSDSNGVIRNKEEIITKSIESGKAKYERLKWDEFFATAITKPSPSGFQSKVLHPIDDRVISAREQARSQGFPDDFIFEGELIHWYRQTGNAVPPLLSKAIGREIRKVSFK